MKIDHLLFGAAYYNEYLLYDRIKTDMEMIAKSAHECNPDSRIHMEHMGATYQKFQRKLVTDYLA